MSIDSDNSNKKCVVCGAYLFEEDDVVYCPECGAPHHRDCYNSVGHCGLEQYHQTAMQYDKQKENDKTAVQEEKTAEPETKTVECSMCGTKYDASEKACPSCNAPNFNRMGGNFVNFDFLGGVPGDLDIGEGVTADEAKRFVMSNTYRYIPKFAQMNLGKRASWNWIAFFFPSGWFLSRKMYKYGFLAVALLIAFILPTIPFVYQMNSVIPSDIAGNYSAMMNWAQQNLTELVSPALTVFAFVGGLLRLVLMILCGIFGDYIYRNHVIASVKVIKENSDDKDYDMRKKGGVSLWLMLLGIIIVEYLPSFVTLFLDL